MVSVYGPGNVGPVGKPNQTTNKIPTKVRDNQNKSFKNILADETQKQTPVKFSKHARSRINSRNIQMTPERLEKLNNAVDKAAAKGAKESLILIDKTAFVVSIDKNTVITAADENQLQDKVFTNIDSAVIV